MRTTVASNNSLFEQAKAAAHERHLTLGAYIEESVRHYLPDTGSGVSEPIILRTAGHGGFLPDVDPASNASLFDRDFCRFVGLTIITPTVVPAT